MVATFRAMLLDTQAQGLLEYALIISMIAVVGIAALLALAQKTNTTLMTPAASALPG